METRPYFLLGDLFSNMLAGAVVGLVCAAVVEESWSVLFGTAAGMLLGMLITFPVNIVCGIFFGAFEVMLPMMLSGMTAGMVVGMAAAMETLSWAAVAGLGAKLGLGVLAFTYLVNAFAKGEVRRWTS